MNIKATLTIAIVAVLTQITLPSQAEMTIASKGQSSYTIILPQNCPKMLKEAAGEMQKDIAIATGATLPIVHNPTKVKGYYISLGTTSQAVFHGYSTKDMPLEGYRIVTNNNNLYIFGPDTPDGQWTKFGGISNGTADGVYVFLEKYLGVRWLMPGDIGRDVPERKTWTLENIDYSDAPMFNMRKLGHVFEYTTHQQYLKASRWLNHMRVGSSGSGTKTAFRGSVNPAYGHNWWRTVNRSAQPNPLWHGTNNVHTKAVKNLYKKHPQWFAMNAHGKRPLPKNSYAKLETTNPNLVKWFAKQAIRKVKASKRSNYFSLSPSDGNDWSQSPESKALYDPSPANLFDHEAPRGRPSMSSLVLKWYHDIATIVAQKYPQGRLGGFFYASYLYPPKNFRMKLPANFTPTIAFSPSYGFGMYRKDTQQAFHYVMDSWAKVAPENWYYYDLPNQLFRQYVGNVGRGYGAGFPGSTAIVQPAAPEILNTIFRSLVKNHIKGTILYGITSWSSSAMSNYLLAKMEWNPTLNAYDIQRQWLSRAYGPTAGKVMESFYHNLNKWLGDYVRKNNIGLTNLKLNTLRSVYARHYPALEKIYLTALAQPMTHIQQKRLQLIGANLIVLQWRLRNVGFLPNNFHSKLTRSDDQVIALIKKPNPDFVMFPGAINLNSRSGWHKAASYTGKVQWSASAPSQKKISNSFPSGLHEGTIVLYSSKDQKIIIEPELVTQSAYFATYFVKNKSGQKIKTGILHKTAPIIIQAKADQPYYLYVVPRKDVNYRLNIKNAAIAQIGYDAKDKTLLLWGGAAGIHIAQIPGKQVGLSEADGFVKIVRPFTGADFVQRLIRTGNYSKVRVLASLTSNWKFYPDPNNNLTGKKISQLKFNDSQWSDVSTLNWWQMQGFKNYHGPAWYRMVFTIPDLKPHEATRFYCGSADGNVEIYFNGHKIHGHKVGPPPDYEGWNKRFSRHIYHGWWKPGKNVLAIKVTSKNDTSASGITGGVAIIGRINKNHNN